MRFRAIFILPFLIGYISVYAQSFSFSELESMIGQDFAIAESYLLQNSNWEAAGEVASSRGIRVKYENKKRNEKTEDFNLVDLYKSEKKNALVGIMMQFKSREVYQQYTADLKSNGYEEISKVNEDGKFGRRLKKSKMRVILERVSSDDLGDDYLYMYYIILNTRKKYK